MVAVLGLVSTFGFTAADADGQGNWRETRSGKLDGSGATVDLSGASFGGDGTLWSVDNKLNRVVRWTDTGSGWRVDDSWGIGGIDGRSFNDFEGISWVSPGRIIVVDEASNRALFISISERSGASLERAVDLARWVGAPSGGDGLEAVAHSAAESGSAQDVFYVGLENSAEMFRVVLPAGSSTPSDVTERSLAIPEVAGMAIDETSGEIYIMSEANKTAYRLSSWSARPSPLFSVPDMVQPEGIDVADGGDRVVVIGEGAQEYSEWTSATAPRPTPTPQPTSTRPPAGPGGGDEVPSDVNVPAGAQLSVASPLQSADDAEQRSSSEMYLDSSDLELLEDGGDAQYVGIRFRDVGVPANAQILMAWIEFQADESSTEQTSVRIRGEANPNPAAFSSRRRNISDRPTTTASVQWSPSRWPIVGESHNTPDVSGIVGELVSDREWASGQSMVFVFDGSGRRTAESVEGDGRAAELHVIWRAATNPQPTPRPRPTPRPTQVPTQVPDGGGGGGGQIVASIASGADDVEQRDDGSLNVDSRDLDLALSSRQPVGLRYNVCIPRGATVTSATITLTADEADTTPTSMTLWSEVAGDAAPFANRNVRSRTRSSQSVTWRSLPAWSPGRVEVSPDLSALVTQVTSSSSWNGCGHIVFIIEATGDRTAISYEANPSRAPVLEIEFD